MFGNDHKNDQDDVQPMSAQPVNHGLLGIDDEDTPPATGISGLTSSAPPVTPAAPNPVSAPGPVIAPHVEDSSNGNDLSTPPTSKPQVDDDTPLAAVSPAPSSTPSSSPGLDVDESSSDEDLLNIKKEALEELSPLIDHLDQDSEEKFKTTMMMIQASDNKDLIPQAFAAAKAITDEKKRAQALLDIVNEINYFTHKTED